MRGPNSRFPFQALSKRQTCVSHGTQEAAIVGAKLALRVIAIPPLPLWGTLLPQKVHLTFHEDNQAVIYVCKTGAIPHRARSVERMVFVWRGYTKTSQMS